MTDPRVFVDGDSAYSTMMSSLPPSLSGSRVVAGVGIRFLPLPDMGKLDRGREPMRRVWSGQALETEIVRRVIPEFPAGVGKDAEASVVVEYLIGTDGAVEVLRMQGPREYAEVVGKAMAGWQYRPVRFQDRLIEVVGRLEVRFAGRLG